MVSLPFGKSKRAAEKQPDERPHGQSGEELPEGQTEDVGEEGPRRTIRLFDTSVEVRTDQGDRMWDVMLRRALIERMGCNNAGYIARVCPPNDYNRFVLSEAGENFFGCSTDITELPYFDTYREKVRQMVGCQIAHVSYGVPLSVFDRGYERRMRNRPLELEEVDLAAEERCARIVEEAKAEWARLCATARERYGDVYAEVFGEGAEPPHPHDMGA